MRNKNVISAGADVPKRGRNAPLATAQEPPILAEEINIDQYTTTRKRAPALFLCVVGSIIQAS